MKIELTPVQARVLGVLVEKERTTPDTYPMSLNGIAAGCNQKSSRDPVMELSESEVQDAVDGLVKATLVRQAGAAGGRVQRYAHRLGMRLFGEYEFSAAERAVLCVLLLRGAQTPGEIRTRSGRLHDFADVAEVESVLAGLATRGDGPHVAELPREPGRRENRWVHCFCGGPEIAPPETPSRASTAAPAAMADDRVALLEARVLRLETELATLRRELGLPEEEQT